MKLKLSSSTKKLLEIFLTSLISAGIAFLQNYLKQKGLSVDVNVSPSETGLIGAGVASAKVAFNSNMGNTCR